MLKLQRILLIVMLWGAVSSNLLAADKLRWLRPNGATGTTYATIADRAGQAWNGSAFATWTSTRSNWVIAMSQVGSTSEYTTVMPSIPGGTYIDIRYWNQVGGSPSDANDTLLGANGGYWDGQNLLADKPLITVNGQAYNNVLIVGSGQTYTTITAAQNAASAGDLVYVLPGTYNECVGKNGVDFYLGRGVTLNYDGADGVGQAVFDLGVISNTNFRVFGYGKIAPAGGFWPIVVDLTGVDFLLECDNITASSDLLEDNTGSSGQVVVRAKSQISVTGTYLNNSGGTSKVDIEAPIISSKRLVSNASTGGTTYVRGDVITLTDPTPISGSTGRVVLEGNFNCTNSSSNGINSTSGATVVLVKGSVTVPAGRPSLSGAGTMLVSNAFAYDTASATASGLAATTAELIAKAIPNVAPAANGGMATVDGNNRIAGIQGSVNNLNNLDVAVSSRVATSSVPSVTQIRQEIDTNSTQLAAIRSTLDGAPSFASAMDTQGYTSALAAKLEKVAPTLLVSTSIAGAPTSQTTFALTAGPPDNGALNGAIVVVTSSTNSARKAIGLIKNYVSSTKTVTLVADPGIYTMANGDSVDVIAGGTSVPLWLGH